MGTEQVRDYRGVFLGGEKEGAIVDIDGTPEREGRTFDGALTGEASTGFFLFGVRKEFERESWVEVATARVERLHGCLEDEDEEKGGEVVALVDAGKVLEKCGVLALLDGQLECFIHSCDDAYQTGGETIFFEDQKHQLVVHSVERLHEVDEDDPCFVPVFFSYLQSRFQIEHRVRASLPFQTSTGFVESIPPDERVHSLCDDRRHQFIGDVEEKEDWAPVPWTRRVAFLKDGT